ncbi:MAG: hypothetical protein AAF982_03880 [Pseudomonadota bacterium]
MPRTLLEIIQDAAPRIGLSEPGLLFASTNATEIEMRKVANEVAERLIRAHDWSLLRTLRTTAGDGTTTAFDLPADYLRMPKDTQVWSTRWQRPLLAGTAEDILRLDIREYDLIVGIWAIYGGQMHVRPALALGESARFHYTSLNGIAPSSGADKARFTADDDMFRLGDRLFELQFIWEWRRMKGLDYAEDMATAEAALAQAIGEDAGAMILTQAPRRAARAKIAYPWQITPT